LADVSPSAQIGSNVRIGPFCVVERDTSIGSGCILESRATVKRGTSLGEDNHIFEGVVLGGIPQHLHASETSGRTVIGSGNIIRENATVHCALEPGGETRIGENNLLMVNAHIAHDCWLGDHTIITNNVMLAGHVTVEDRVYLSGAAGSHQFCRIGTLSMVGGQAHLVKDVPPYVTVDGLSSLVVGLNQVGLRRAGFDRTDIRELKAAYRLIYRQGLAWDDVLTGLRTQFPTGPAAVFYRFLSTTSRGITPERRTPPGAVIKIHDEIETRSDLKSRAG